MLKVLAAYRANPTYKNAQKVRAYGRAHPFSTCLLTAFDQDLLANAIFHANSGNPAPTFASVNTKPNRKA